MHRKYSTGINFDKEDRENSFTNLLLNLDLKMATLNYSINREIFEKTEDLYKKNIKFYEGVPLNDS